MTSLDPQPGPGHPAELYLLHLRRPAPPGIPTTPLADDPHSETVFAPSFAERRAAYLAWARSGPPRANLAGVFHELARLAAGGPAHVPLFEAALDYVDARKDCADFVLHGILRLLLQFGGDPRVPRALVARAHETILRFKYWPDEPGRDSLCTWTENHQILFASAALVAGELHPDDRFSNAGDTGHAKAAAALPRVLRWLDLRFRTGFSEWLSHVYYDEDVVALTTLVDFASDTRVRRRAEMVLDLLFFDMALHHHRGVFGSTHGRSYERAKKWAREEGTTDLAKLALGVGRFAGGENQSAACLAASTRYRLPEVIAGIAADAARPEVHVRQRMSFRIEEAIARGLDPAEPEDMMVLLSMEAYLHPRTIDGFTRLLDRFGWWTNAFFAPFRARRGLLLALRRARLLPLLARAFEPDLTRNLRDEVHVTTFRTPDTMLSSAQDWRPGMGGDQQHVWQATLGPDAVCFTTHPGPRSGRSPSHWTGSASLPRVAQVRNVLLCLYSISRRPALYVANRKRYTHAWLPRDRFDEVREQAGWIFARRGDGYLALRARDPHRWQTAPGEDAGREVIADGRTQVWICELGRRAEAGSFDAFVQRIADSRVVFGDRSVAYDSPSEGRLELDWEGPLRHGGRDIPLHDAPRYDTPYGGADFPSLELRIAHAGATLHLDWRSGRRDVSAFA